MGHFFTRNPLTWILFSTKISLHMSLFFQNFQAPENCKKWAYILRKIHKMGTFFCPNDLKTWVRVSRLKRQTPVQTKSKYPPGDKSSGLPLRATFCNPKPGANISECNTSKKNQNLTSLQHYSHTILIGPNYKSTLN